jgi:hypothetical protein
VKTSLGKRLLFRRRRKKEKKKSLSQAFHQTNDLLFHNLAKEAITHYMVRTWRDSTPINIFDIVALEQSALF